MTTDVMLIVYLALALAAGVVFAYEMWRS